MILVTVTSDELVYQEYWFDESKLYDVIATLNTLEHDLKTLAK